MQNVPVHAFQPDVCTVNLIGKGNHYPQCPGKFSIWNGWRWAACSGFCIFKSQFYSNLQNASLSCWSPVQAPWNPTNNWWTLSTEIKKSLHECCLSSCSQPDVLKMLQAYSQHCGILHALEKCIPREVPVIETVSRGITISVHICCLHQV